MRKRFLAALELKAEDAARVACLPADTTAQLQIAARGAVERQLASWKMNVEQMVRAQIRDATFENVRQRLVGIDNFYFGDAYAERSFRGPQPVWDAAVQTALTPGQNAAWQKETDARRAYHDQSVAMGILAEFDLGNPVTGEQWNRLETLLEKAIEDYGQDIDRVFSSPWYQERYSMFLPFAFVPEKEMKAILTPDQWDRWTGSQEFANTSNYSRNIEQIHDQRVKAKK